MAAAAAAAHLLEAAMLTAATPTAAPSQLMLPPEDVPVRQPPAADRNFDERRGRGSQHFRHSTRGLRLPVPAACALPRRAPCARLALVLHTIDAAPVFHMQRRAGEWSGWLGAAGGGGGGGGGRRGGHGAEAAAAAGQRDDGGR